MKTKKFQLVIKNIETNKYTIKEVNFREESHAIQYFKKNWSDKYYILADINELFEDNDIQIGDLVEVIHADGEYCTENLVPFVGQKGKVIEVDPDWEYPYLIEFNKEIEEKYNRSGHLWKKDNLRVI